MHITAATWIVTLTVLIALIGFDLFLAARRPHARLELAGRCDEALVRRVHFVAGAHVRRHEQHQQELRAA